MSSSHATPRRRREPGDRNRNIYRRYDDRFEVGYRDSTGRQRWTRAYDTVTAARAARDDLLGRKARGDRVQPNPWLRFGEAADRWLGGQVVDLRPATQAIYRNAIDNHLRPRWGRHRLDAITVDDAANLVRDLRADGLADNSIVGIIQVANRVFKYAQRRLDSLASPPVSRPGGRTPEFPQLPWGHSTRNSGVQRYVRLAHRTREERAMSTPLDAIREELGRLRPQVAGLERAEAALVPLYEPPEAKPRTGKRGSSGKRPPAKRRTTPRASYANPTPAQVRAYVVEHGPVVRDDIVTALGGHPKTVGTYIRKLLDQGLIAADGKPPGRRYRAPGSAPPARASAPPPGPPERGVYPVFDAAVDLGGATNDQLVQRTGLPKVEIDLQTSRLRGLGLMRFESNGSERVWRATPGAA